MQRSARCSARILLAVLQYPKARCERVENAMFKAVVTIINRNESYGTVLKDDDGNFWRPEKGYIDTERMLE